VAVARVHGGSLIVTVLFALSQAGATVKLGTTTALLISQVLACTRSEQTNMLRILTAALELRGIVGSRELILLADATIGVMDSKEELDSISKGQLSKTRWHTLGR